MELIKKRLAIVGTGISGLAVAHFCLDKYDIDIYEKTNNIGGHARTITLDDGRKIDTGFIVFNKKTYPLLCQLFDETGIRYTPSDMSFAVKMGKFEFGTPSFKKLFSQKTNLFNYKFYGMIYDIVRFFNRGEYDIKNNKNLNINMGEYIHQLGLGDYAINRFILPMGAAIWSSTPRAILNYPAKAYLEFMYNHGLLTINQQPQWFTVHNGSESYIKIITQKFNDKIMLANPVKAIEAQENKLIITDSHQRQRIYDRVVIATSAPEGLQLLQNPTAGQLQIMGKFQTQKNAVIVHNDISVMPRNKNAWSSWVFHSEDSNQLGLSYWMNNLQKHIGGDDVFVSLNYNGQIKGKIYDRHDFHHPIYDANSNIGQVLLPQIQGENGIYWVGAYQFNGFHEDGMRSAKRVIDLLS